MNIKLTVFIAALTLPLLSQANHKYEHGRYSKHYSTQSDTHAEEQYQQEYDQAESFTTTASVVNTKALFEDVRVNKPEYNCYDQQVSYPGDAGNNGLIGAVAGGAVGGVLGNQIGKGGGRDVATVLGAVLGAVVGHDVTAQQQTNYYTDVERRCEEVDNYVTERNLTGYEVKYRYNGRTYTTIMDQRPGKVIDLQVSIQPLGY